MAELLKYRLGQGAIEQIAGVLVRVSPDFPQSVFIRQSLLNLEPLELKQRVHHLIAVLAECLPRSFTEAATILQQIPRHWQASGVAGGYSTEDYGFAVWPLIDYVSVHGLHEPELALQTLEVLTPLFTAEYAIRPFLQQHFELSYSYLQRWTTHDNHHVRRLASEGCRPRLPWGQRVPLLMKQPEIILPILEQLKDDDSDYVRRSVANNLNDISKDYPEVVLTLAQQWLNGEPSKHRQWIIKHATRGLVKAGHADVFALLGHSQAVTLENACLTLDQTVVSMGDSITLDFGFSLPEAHSVVIDYALHLPRANGKTSVKVFKWQSGKLAAGDYRLSRNYTFKALTTRRYYAGQHAFEVLVNGRSCGKMSFDLRC